MTEPKKRRRKRPYYETVDRLFSQVIRLRGECELRGTTERCSGVLQCCHGFSRRYWALRYDRRNCWAGCAGCHLYFTHRPDEWAAWRRDRWGDDLHDELWLLALNGRRPSQTELEALAAEFRAELKEAGA